AGFVPAVQRKDARVGSSDLVDEITRAVRATVVDDQNMCLGKRPVQPVQHRGEAVAFVVRRDDHQYPAGRLLGLPSPAGFGARHPVPSVSSVGPPYFLRCRYIPVASVSNAIPISVYSTDAPSRSAGVCVVRRGTLCTRVSAVNNSVDSTTLPSGRTTALTPLVAATTTALLCSMARSRAIANCW